jgi:hypothetical protein
MTPLYRGATGPLSFHSLKERCTSKIAEAPGALFGHIHNHLTKPSRIPLNPSHFPEKGLQR